MKLPDLSRLSLNDTTGVLPGQTPAYQTAEEWLAEKAKKEKEKAERQAERLAKRAERDARAMEGLNEYQRAEKRKQFEEEKQEKARKKKEKAQAKQERAEANKAPPTPEASPFGPRTGVERKHGLLPAAEEAWQRGITPEEVRAEREKGYRAVRAEAHRQRHARNKEERLKDALKAIPDPGLADRENGQWYYIRDQHTKRFTGEIGRWRGKWAEKIKAEKDPNDAEAYQAMEEDETPDQSLTEEDLAFLDEMIDREGDRPKDKDPAEALESLRTLLAEGDQPKNRDPEESLEYLKALLAEDGVEWDDLDD